MKKYSGQRRGERTQHSPELIREGRGHLSGVDTERWRSLCLKMTLLRAAGEVSLQCYLRLKKCFFPSSSLAFYPSNTLLCLFVSQDVTLFLAPLCLFDVRIDIWSEKRAWFNHTEVVRECLPTQGFTLTRTPLK